MPRVALALTGDVAALPADGGDSISRHLLPSLGTEADTLCIVRHRQPPSQRRNVSEMVQQKLGPLRHTTWRVVIRRQPSVDWLVTRFEALPHFPRILDALLRAKVNCTRVSKPQSHISPWSCNHWQDGASIFQPVLRLDRWWATPQGTGALYFLYGVQCLLQLVSETEVEENFLYDRLVFSRLDSNWLAPHPPLDLLAQEHIWVPQGQDYFGLNDRHAVLNRTHADTYFRRFDYILSGMVMQIDPQLRGPRPSYRDQRHYNGEAFNANVARWARYSVRRFPVTSFLPCCDAALERCTRSACFACSRLAMPSKLRTQVRRDAHHDDADLGDLAEHLAAQLHGQQAGHLETARGKYFAEVAAASRNAMLLSLPGVRYEPVQERVTEMLAGGALNAKASAADGFDLLGIEIHVPNALAHTANIALHLTGMAGKAEGGITLRARCTAGARPTQAVHKPSTTDCNNVSAGCVQLV